MSTKKVDSKPQYEIWQFHSGKYPTRIHQYEHYQDIHKIDISIVVKGADQYPRNKLKAKFESRSLHFKLEDNLSSVEINLFIDNLAHEIDPSKSSFKVVHADKVVITLSKVKPQIWKSIIYAPDIVRKSWNEDWRKFVLSATGAEFGEMQFVSEEELKYQWRLSECLYTDDLSFYLNAPYPYGPIPELQDVKTINEAIETMKNHIITKRQSVYLPNLLGAAILYKLLETHKEAQTKKSTASSSTVMESKKVEKKVLIKEPRPITTPNLVDRLSKYTFVPAADIKRFQGNELFEKGKFEEAIKSYTEAIKIDSSCPTYYNQRAACYMKLRKYQKAMEDANEALSIDASSSEALYYKGKSAFLLGRIFEGIMLLSMAVKLDPLSSNIDMAIQQQNCMKLAKMVERSTEAIGYGRTKEGKKLFSELMKYCDVELVDLKKNLYEDLCGARLHLSAKQLIKLDLKDNPNDRQAVFYLMKCCFYENEKEEALNCLSFCSSVIDSHYEKLILKLNDEIESFYSLMEKGDQALERKDVEAAQHCYILAVNVDPSNHSSNANLHHKIGECLMQQKDYKQAAKSFSLALKDDDRHKQARTKLKECLKYLKRYKNDPDYELLKSFANADLSSDHLYRDLETKLIVSNKPNKAMKKLTLLKQDEAREYQLKNQFELAIDSYSEAIETEQNIDNLVNLYIKRSQCHYELENYRRAYQDAVEAGRLETDNVDACIQMGKCCIVLADTLKEAESMLTIAYNLNHRPDFYNITNISGEISKLQVLTRRISLADEAFTDKKFEDASKMYEEVLTIAKGSDEMKLKRAECLIYLGKFKAAETIAESIASSGNSYPEHECLLGMLSYHKGDLTKAILHFKRAQEISNVHHKSIELKGKAEGLLKIKNDGSRAFAKNNFRTALSLYRTAVKIDPQNKFLNSVFFFNIGLIQLKQMNLPDAIGAFSSAISVRENHLLAYLKRAECHLESGRRDLAVEDYEKVCKLFPSEEHNKLLHDNRKILEEKTL